MAERKVYIGSVGPFLFDDADLINDSDGDFSGETYGGFVTDGFSHVGGILSDEYVNVGGGKGETGWGIRDNAGVVEYKDDGGDWTPFQSVKESFKVGSYYFNTGNDPATELGYGTWVQVARGEILIGHS